MDTNLFPSRRNGKFLSQANEHNLYTGEKRTVHKTMSVFYILCSTADISHNEEYVW